MADKQKDSPPDRLSLDPRSEFYDETLLSRGVGIKFNGQEKTSVIEYSISEGWIRVVGERWRALAETPPVPSGARVTVTGVDGLTLKVRKGT